MRHPAGLTVSPRLITSRPRVPGQRRRRRRRPFRAQERAWRSTQRGERTRRRRAAALTARPAPAGRHLRRRGGVPPRRPGQLPADPQPRPRRGRAARGRPGRHLHAEITTTQLEAVTGICTGLAELRAELVTTRAEAAGAAARAGVRILAASTHPFDSWQQQDITPAPRYEAMVDRWAGLALQQDICGCHVHVGVPDLETAVAVMDRARPYLPVLLAMTGSSPFHDGVDTGHHSYRTMWWSRWPMTGTAGVPRQRRAVPARWSPDWSPPAWSPTPPTSTGTSARPATCPTLEFRLADVCTEVDDVVLHAALARSLVRVLAARAERGRAVPATCGPSCCARPGGGPPGTASTVSCSTSLRCELVPGADRRPPAAGRAAGGPARPRRVGRRRRAGGAAVRAGDVGRRGSAGPGCAPATGGRWPPASSARAPRWRAAEGPVSASTARSLRRTRAR